MFTFRVVKTPSSYYFHILQFSGYYYTINKCASIVHKVH